MLHRDERRQNEAQTHQKIAAQHHQTGGNVLLQFAAEYAAKRKAQHEKGKGSVGGGILQTETQLRFRLEHRPDIGTAVAEIGHCCHS